MMTDASVSLDGRSLASSAPQRGLGPVRCVFSTDDSQDSGKTTAQGRRGRVRYWFVCQDGEDGYVVRGLDDAFLPFGEESAITSDELIVRYTPEVAVFENRMLPSVRRNGYRPAETCRVADDSLLPPAVDEANVRGLFELARELLLARRTAKGRVFLGELLRVRTPFPGKDQHLFNEFGIALRKIGFLDGAAICYRRALKYAEKDDHLYYNLARVYYEQGQWWDCMTTLGRCFEFNPDLPLARDLAALIHALADNPGLRRRYGKPPVPEGVARRAALLCDILPGPDTFVRARIGAGQPGKLSEAAAPSLDQRRDRGLSLPGRDAVGM
jgi:tetratricopeptide (TPR) repeat protein